MERQRWVRLVGVAALLFVAPACGGSGSSGGSASCSDVPRGKNVAVDRITFERWMGLTGEPPVFVAFASSVEDKGGATTGQRNVELQSPELVNGQLPAALTVDEIAIRHAKAIMSVGDRLLVWGQRGFLQTTVLGNLVVISGDGSVRFAGNCIPRFDSAFATFVASLGSSEPAVDVLVRILTGPTGDTATRFKATAGMTQAGP